MHNVSQNHGIKDNFATKFRIIVPTNLFPINCFHSFYNSNFSNSLVLDLKKKGAPNLVVYIHKDPTYFCPCLVLSENSDGFCCHCCQNFFLFWGGQSLFY